MQELMYSIHWDENFAHDIHGFKLVVNELVLFFIIIRE